MDIFTGESSSHGRSRITFNDEVRAMGVGTKEGVDISDFKLDLSRAIQPGRELALVHCCHENTHVPSADKKSQLMILGFCGRGQNMQEAIRRIQAVYPVPVEVRQSCVAFTLSKQSPTMQNVRENHERALKNLKVSIGILEKNRADLEKSSKQGKQTPVKITNDSALRSLRDSFERSSKRSREGSKEDASPAANAGAGESPSPSGGEEEGKEEYDLEELGPAAATGNGNTLPSFPVTGQSRGQNYAVVCVIEDYDCTLQREKIIDQFLARRTGERSRRYQEWLARACEDKGVQVPADEEIEADLSKWTAKNPSPLSIKHNQKRERLVRDAAKWLGARFVEANQVLPEGYDTPVPSQEDIDGFVEQPGATKVDYLRKKFLEANPDLAAEAGDLSSEDLEQWWDAVSRRAALQLPDGVVVPDWENDHDLLSDEFAGRYLSGEFGTPNDAFADQEFVQFSSRVPAPPTNAVTTQQEVDDFDCYLWARRLAMEKQLLKWKVSKTDFPAEEDVMKDWDVENPPPEEGDLPQEEPGVIVLNCHPTEEAARGWIDKDGDSIPGIENLDLHVIAMYDFVHPPHSRDSTIKKQWRNKKQHQLLTKMSDSKAAIREVEAFSRSQGKKVKIVEASANAVEIQDELPEGVTQEQWDEWQRVMRANGDQHRARMAQIEAEEGRLFVAEAEHKKACKMARIRGERAPEAPASLVEIRERVKGMKVLNEDKCDDLSAVAPGRQ